MCRNRTLRERHSLRCVTIKWWLREENHLHTIPVVYSDTAAAYVLRRASSMQHHLEAASVAGKL